MAIPVALRRRDRWTSHVGQGDRRCLTRLTPTVVGQRAGLDNEVRSVAAAATVTRSAELRANEPVGGSRCR